MKAQFPLTVLRTTFQIRKLPQLALLILSLLRSSRFGPQLRYMGIVFSIVASVVSVGATLGMLTACGIRPVPKSNDFVQGSKGVTVRMEGASMGQAFSRADLESIRSPAPWSPIIEGLRPSDGHIAQVVEVFPLPVAGASAGHRFVLSVDKSGMVLLWSLADSRAYEVGALGISVDLAALSPNGRILAYSRGSELGLFSLPHSRSFGALQRLKSRGTSLAFHPSSESLLMGGADGRIYRWKFLTDKEHNILRGRNKNFERYIGHGTVVSSVAYHPHGRVFLSGDWRGSLNAWLAYDADLFDGEYDENVFGGDFFSDQVTRRKGVRANQERIDRIVIHSKGVYFVVGTGNGNLEYWTVRGFRKLAETEAHRGLLRGLAIDPSAKQIASYGRDGKLRVWKVEVEYNTALEEDEYELVLHKELPLEALRKLSYVDPETVVAGTEAGQVLAVDLSKIEEVERDESLPKEKSSV